MTGNQRAGNQRTGSERTGNERTGNEREAGGQATGYPLAGLRVLDFSRVLAGPFAGRMLSDLGADVVKVEPPDGDVTRFWGRVVGGLPGYYHQQNAGKRNVCIDLRAPAAAALVLELVRAADILIENYRPDVMPRLGLGYDVLATVNPHLIMLSISGFGQGGPESDRPAYAPVIHAELGLMRRAMRRGGTPPRDLPLSVADTNASLHGLVAVLAAVIQRGHTGLGQHIDMAMIDATLATDDQVHYDLEDAEATAPLPNDTYATGVGDVLVSSDFRVFWRLLVQHWGLADPAHPDQPMAERIAARQAAARAFMAGLSSWDAVAEVMARMNVAWGEVRGAETLRDQATVRHRHSIVDVDDRAGGTRPVVQSPYRFSRASSGVRGPAPHRGEHNAAVLLDWLGYARADVAALAAAGVLQSDGLAEAPSGPGIAGN
ncbi:MAG: CaiB/BaiF CoA transferase family protein [Gammaproteobacteria bacterium]